MCARNGYALNPFLPPKKEENFLQFLEVRMLIQPSRHCKSLTFIKTALYLPLAWN